MKAFNPVSNKYTSPESKLFLLIVISLDWNFEPTLCIWKSLALYCLDSKFSKFASTPPFTTVKNSKYYLNNSLSFP